MTTAASADQREARGLTASTFRGAAWNLAAFALGKGLVLVSTIVVARLIPPAEFGVMALGLLVIAYLEPLNDLGLGSAVIYHRGDPVHVANVAFTLSLAVGIGLTVVTVATAPGIAGFFDEPDLTAVIVALASTFLIVTAGSIQNARMRRQLAFRRRFGPELGRAAVKAGVTIGLAVAGLGVWALVWGQIVGAATGAALYWVLDRWRPRLTLDWPLGRRLLRYGGGITLVGLLSLVVSNLDYVLIGRRLGTEELGFYTIAFRLPGLLVMDSCWMVSQAVFPAYASLDHDLPSLRRALLKSARALTAMTVPIGFGLAVVADDLVPVLFGARWEAATPLLSILAVFAVVKSITYTDGDCYKAIGRPAILNWITAGSLLVAAPALWFASGVSLRAVAVAQVGIAVVVLAVRAVVAERVLGVRVVELALAALPSLTAGAAMVGVVLVLRHLVLSDLDDAVALGASVVVGALTYLAALWAVDRRWVAELLGLLRSRTA